MRRRGWVRHEPRARTRRFPKRALWERPQPSAKPWTYQVSTDGRRAAGSGHRATGKAAYMKGCEGERGRRRALRLSPVPAPQPGCFTPRTVGGVSRGGR